MADARLRKVLPLRRIQEPRRSGTRTETRKFRLLEDRLLCPPLGKGFAKYFGLVINADDPRNARSDIAYTMPSVWFSHVTMPQEQILHPWKDEFDSLEYSVDLRVPFANSPNPFHNNTIPDDEMSAKRTDYAVPYVLGGLFFEQVRNVKSGAKHPAFWLAIMLFDMRKHFTVEGISVDAWSGGTNYPIVTTTAGPRVVPDRAGHMPDTPSSTPLDMATPVYSQTLPGSSSMLWKGSLDDSFHHFQIRITRQNFLAAVQRIRERIPSLYGVQGMSPMSTDLSDWGLTHFNLDAEIFHTSRLPAMTTADNSRALVVEFKNLSIVQASRQPKELTVVGKIDGMVNGTILGDACYDVPGHFTEEQLDSIRSTPVTVEFEAVDPTGVVKGISLGETLARVPGPQAGGQCVEGINGHRFAYHLPLSRALQVKDANRPMNLVAWGKLGDGTRVRLGDPSNQPLPVSLPVFEDLKGKVFGQFTEIRGRVAVGWACLKGSDEQLPIEIRSVPRGNPAAVGEVVADGFANQNTNSRLQADQACGSAALHGFLIELPTTFGLAPDRSLVAEARPGNYEWASPPREWDTALSSDAASSGFHLTPPALRGFLQSITGNSHSVQVTGWACIPGSRDKMRIRLAGETASGKSMQLSTTGIADRASEPGVQEACLDVDDLNESKARADKAGYRFRISLDASDIAKLDHLNVQNIVVSAGRKGEKDTVLPRVPGGTFTWTPSHSNATAH
jgi:hypothetical protein